MSWPAAAATLKTKRSPNAPAALAVAETRDWARSRRSKKEPTTEATTQEEKE